MNGTLVLRAACATAANCSAVSKSSAAIPMSAPLLSSGFSRTWSAGAAAGIVGVVTEAVAAGASAADRFGFAFAR
jgi:hypothetical protein